MTWNKLGELAKPVPVTPRWIITMEMWDWCHQPRATSVTPTLNIIYWSESGPLTRNQSCGLSNQDTDSSFTQQFNTPFGHTRIQAPSILYSAINQGWVVTASVLGRDRREHGGGIAIVLRVPDQK